MNYSPDIVVMLAERKILEAVKEGMFDDLPGAGKPLPPDDLANLPDDLRLTCRIMRSAGFAPEKSDASDSLSMSELFIEAPEESRMLRRMSGLKIKLSLFSRLKKKTSRLTRLSTKSSAASPDELADAASSDRAEALLDSPYAAEILAKLF
ncbi:MAG: DUF1992 domain-containing protein [Deltaproteobacteria bacterium]|nr:DUF1992 domain-containing protein [Deltaproteobacteria bacterium]